MTTSFSGLSSMAGKSLFSATKKKLLLTFLSASTLTDRQFLQSQCCPGAKINYGQQLTGHYDESLHQSWSRLTRVQSKSRQGALLEIHSNLAGVLNDHRPGRGIRL